MCHLILMAPVIGLGVFLIMPFSAALPIYVVILALSGFVYYVMMKAMREPVMNGPKGLIGQVVKISDMTGHSGHVHVHGEIWNASSDDPLTAGSKAVVVGVNGMTLEIREPSAVRQLTDSDKHCRV